MNQLSIKYGVIIQSLWTLHFLCKPKVSNKYLSIRVQGKTFPKFLDIRIKWIFFLHTFPKLVSPTPRLTLKPLPNGAQTPPVFLYFSTYFEFTPNKVTISISALDVSQIMLKFF